MKKLSTVLLFIGMYFILPAQDCKNYYFFQNAKVIEMTITNKKGEPSGKQLYTVTSATNSGSTATAVVNSEMFDKKGKSITKADMNVKCNGGVMMMDMKIFIPSQQAEQFNKAEATASNVFLEYPSNMKAGDNLKDGNFNMEINNNGLKQTLNMVIDNRKVESKESVTTPAGTWDCFKISFHSKLNIKTGPIGIPMNIEGTEWFAPGFGIVKSESKNGGTEITSIK